ncbi:hypothetical protein L4D06_10945 [Enterovibrio makurazakiensis]|uniref:hypothetical protein n=1 Tax=Enterovibrio makurazakiensis TaxID=2910232 RepID=UPI003D1D166F
MAKDTTTEVALHIRQIEIDSDARYVDVYRAMSAAVSQNWPVLHSVSERQQGIAKEKAIVDATNALMKQLGGNGQYRRQIQSQSQTHRYMERRR